MFGRKAEKPFSKRVSPPPDAMRYEVPEATRSRILHQFQQTVDDPFRSLNAGQFGFGHILDELTKRIQAEYGGFDGDTRRLAFGGNTHPTVIHAMACSDPRFLDFVEFCFQVWPHQLGQAGVEAVNRVFREEAIGFELTPFRETVKDANGNIVQVPAPSTTTFQRSFARTVTSCMNKWFGHALKL